MRNLPLLSKRPLREFSPESFMSYIRSLFFRPEPAVKIKRLRDYKVSWKRLKGGNLSLTTKRVPKYVTREELKRLKDDLRAGENEIFILLKAREVIVASHEEAELLRVSSGRVASVGVTAK